MSTALLDKRETRIRTMFGNIAPSYDLLNHLLSLNIDRYWRWRTTRLAPPLGSRRRSSTSAPAPATWRWPTTRRRSGRVPIVGTDFCLPMLLPARDKTQRRRAAERIRFLEADTQQLPFPDDTFQLTTVAFGLRNVTDTDRGIAEMVRVTQPGGRVAILEFSRPRHWLFGPLYRFYFRTCCRAIGQIISRSKDNAYRLSAGERDGVSRRRGAGGATARAWLDGGEWYPLTFGIATLYVGTKALSSRSVSEGLLSQTLAGASGSDVNRFLPESLLFRRVADAVPHWPPKTNSDSGRRGRARGRGRAALRQRSRVGGVADRQAGQRLEAGRDAIQFTGLVGQDADHLVDEQAASRRLQGQGGAGEAQVVNGGGVGLAVEDEVQTRAAEGQHRHRLRPSLIPFDQAGKQPLELRRVRLGGHDVAPGLLIVRRRRPASRLEQRAEVVGRHRAVGEGVRTPPPGD